MKVSSAVKAIISEELEAVGAAAGWHVDDIQDLWDRLEERFEELHYEEEKDDNDFEGD